jgi:hypothetical protein
MPIKLQRDHQLKKKQEEEKKKRKADKERAPDFGENQ